MDKYNLRSCIEPITLRFFSIKKILMSFFTVLNKYTVTKKNGHFYFCNLSTKSSVSKLHRLKMWKTMGARVFLQKGFNNLLL